MSPPGELSAVRIGAPRPYDGGVADDAVQVGGESGLLLAMTPSHLEAGEWGLATFAFFAEAPTAATTFTTRFTADDPVMSRAVDLAVGAVAAEGDADGLRTATVTNVNAVPVASPYTFAVHCFQGDELVSVTIELIDAANNGFTFDPGTEVTAKFVTDGACTSVLIVAVSFRE